MNFVLFFELGTRLQNVNHLNPITKNLKKMGSQQTRELAHTDLSDLAVSMNDKFSNDICLHIFSFINSEAEFQDFIKSYSKVCRQWRAIILQFCGLKTQIWASSTKDLKSKTSNGMLKYCFIQSITINNSQLKGGDISGITTGLYSTKLKELNINYNPLDDKSMSIIASSLPSLEVLKARGNSIKDKGLLSIAQSQNLKQLKVLDVYANNFSSEGVLSICSSPNMKNLTELNLGYCEIGAEGAKAIVNAFKLKKLEIFSGRIGNEGLIAIANSPNMADLQLLNVEYNYIGEEGALALVNTEYVKNLTKLDISSNEIGATAGNALVGSEILKHIKSLKLGSCGIDQAGAKTLANNPFIKNLTSLGLQNNGIGPEGACALGQSEYLQNLRRLNLHANKPAICDTGLLGLASENDETGSNLFRLEVLEIGLNLIGDVGIKAFAKLSFPALKTLDLSYNDFTDAGDTLLKSSIFMMNTNVKTFDCRNLSSFQPRVCH